MTLIVLLNPKQFETLQGWKKRPRSGGVPLYPEYENFKGKFYLPKPEAAKVAKEVQTKWEAKTPSVNQIIKPVIQSISIVNSAYKSQLDEFLQEPIPQSFLDLLSEMRAKQEPVPDPNWILSELVIHINLERKRRADDEETLALLLSIIH